jgi:hypothetical protein
MSQTIRQNNLQWNREKVNSCSLGAGFEYGVQDGRTVVAEKLWRREKRQRRSCFTLHPPQTQSITLREVQTRVDCAARQHEASQQRRLPRTGPSSNSAVSQQPPSSSSTTHPAPPHNTANATTFSNQFNHSAVPGDYAVNQAWNVTQQPSTTAQSMNIDDDDDGYDALLAGIDVDTLVAKQQSEQSRNNVTNSGYLASSTGSNWNNDTAASSSMQSHSRFNYGSQSNSMSGDNNSRFVENLSTSHYDTSYSNYGESGGNGNISSSTSNYANPNHNHGSFIQASELNFGSFNGDNINNFQSSNDSPPCPGHSLPCALLTARSGANAGRQFYKCSLPIGQQCEFFQWADGKQESNASSSTYESNSQPAYGSTGPVKDIVRENRIKFGHQKFRQGQEEVIRNAMQGRDVFVLMPTGGGKSLCYQLPAWCAPGLSVVVSPLLSLIQDQVQSLTKLGVKAVFMSSNNQAESKDIVQELYRTGAHDGIKLLYLTPEKINHSGQAQSILRNLYNKNLISRFVIDEAHCKLTLQAPLL